MRLVLAYGKITGDGQMAFAGYRQLQDALKQLAGRPFTFELKAMKEGATGPMISYFEAVIVPAIKQALTDQGTSYSIDQVREYIKANTPFISDREYNDLDFEDWVFFLGEIRVWAGQNLHLAFESEIVLSKLT